MDDSLLSLFKDSLIEKNATFLFGAGASAPYFTSLGNFEELLSHEDIEENGKGLIKVLFYYKSIHDNKYIHYFMNDECYNHEKSNLMLSIIDEYSRFLHNGVEFLKVRNSRISPKRMNIVTTNYDLFLESAMDHLLEKNPRIFINDGTNGYRKKLISTDNFNKTLLYSGVFDNYSNEMPAINLIKCHGSVNWKSYPKKNNLSKIQVKMEKSLISDINTKLESFIDEFDKYLKESSLDFEFKSIAELIEQMNELKFTDESREIEFINNLNLIGEDTYRGLEKIVGNIEDLQIVLPTKDKFQTTLIQEHYFSMLRLLSYELEKKQSLLVVFGFSFQDEHITEIVERSLNNPTLLVIVFCFTDQQEEEIILNFNFSNNNVPVNLKFIKPNTFLVDEVNEDEIESEDHFDHTIIIKEETAYKYLNVVSVLEDNGTSIPVLDFSSINNLLETDIINKYKPFEKEKTEQNIETELRDIE